MRLPRNPVARLLAGLTSIAMLVTLSGCFADNTSSGDSQARLRMVEAGPPRASFSPYSDDSFKLAQWNAVESLTALDDEGIAQPKLATEWEQTDDTTWVFTIRENVKFHNGTELTPEIVANSIQHAIDAEPQPKAIAGTGLQVEVQDGKVAVSTEEPDPLVPERLASPGLMILDEPAFESTPPNPANNGTGAFVLTNVDGENSATLDRFDDYWDGAAKLAGLDVTYASDAQARTSALRTGDVDYASTLPISQLANLDEDTIHTVVMPRVNVLLLNNESGPFADPAVRAAAREAINQDTYVDNIYEGRADVPEGLLSSALPWTTQYRDDDFYTDIMADRADAGTVDGIEITIGTYTSRPELAESATLLQQQLEAAGFVVTLDIREYDYIEDDALAGNFDAFILSRSVVVDSGDPVSFLQTDFTCEGSYNIAQFCDPQVDEAISQAASAAVGEERQQAIMTVEAMIMADDAAIPLVWERVHHGQDPKVKEVAYHTYSQRLITNQTYIDEE